MKAKPRDCGVPGAEGKSCIKEEEVPLISKDCAAPALQPHKDYGNPGFHPLCKHVPEQMMGLDLLEVSLPGGLLPAKCSRHCSKVLYSVLLASIFLYTLLLLWMFCSLIVLSSLEMVYIKMWERINSFSDWLKPKKEKIKYFDFNHRYVLFKPSNL